MSKVTDHYKKRKDNQRAKGVYYPAPSSQWEVNEEDGSTTISPLQTLKEFDLNGKYGPCIGITRLERWERAFKHDLDPPRNVRDILENCTKDDEEFQQSLWYKYELN